MTVNLAESAFEPELRILFLVQEKSDPGGNELTNHCRNCSAGYAHTGTAEQTEDHNGIQDDIRQRSAELCDHREHRIAGGLEHTLEIDRKE